MNDQKADARPKILYYSDCFIFGGCEKVITRLINDRELNDVYAIRFAYRVSSEYQAGVSKYIKSDVIKFPVRLLTNDSLFHRLDRINYGVFGLLASLVRILFGSIKKTGIYNLYNFFRLVFLFRTIKPAVLHINNGGYPGAASCRVAVFSAKLAGIKRIIFQVSNLAYEQRGFLDRMIDRFINRKVDRFIVYSIESSDRLIKRRGIDPRKIKQIYAFIDEIAPARTRDELRGEYGIGADKYVISSVGLLMPRKGQSFLLNALNDIKNDFPQIYTNIYLLLVGEGEDRNMLEKYVEKNGLGGHVSLTGFRDDFIDYINASDLFVLPSVMSEDMPLVVLHAMELKVPVISTRLAGITEQLRDGIDGALLEVDELDQLSKAIVDLYSDRPKRIRYAENAYLRYKEYFTFKKLFEEYRQLYRQLIDGKIKEKGSNG